MLLAASPLLEGVTGRYYEDNQPATVTTEPAAGDTGVAHYATDQASAEHLWNETVRLLGA